MNDIPELVDVDFERKWHLAEGETDAAVTKAEHALLRCYEGFARWQSACLGAEADLVVSGPEDSLLHLIRMHDTPKSMTELLRMTNRVDVPNVQYALRKLGKAGLNEKIGSGRAGVTNAITPKGRDLTERYAALRQHLLIEDVKATDGLVPGLEEAARALNALSGVYQKAVFLAEARSRRRRGDT